MIAALSHSKNRSFMRSIFVHVSNRQSFLKKIMGRKREAKDIDFLLAFLYTFFGGGYS